MKTFVCENYRGLAQKILKSYQQTHFGKVGFHRLLTNGVFITLDLNYQYARGILTIRTGYVDDRICCFETIHGLSGVVIGEDFELIDSSYEDAIAGLDWLGELIDFSLDPCCVDMRWKFWNLNWNKDFGNRCRYCGRRILFNVNRFEHIADIIGG